MVSQMTCDLQVDPLVASLQPRFGWQLQSGQPGDYQKAYQVLVGSDTVLLLHGKADCWNSKKVLSGQSQFVDYAGKPLQPGRLYYWTVRVWDASGKLSASSSIARFRLAPANNVLNAEWIGAITKADSHLPKGRNWHGPSMKNNTVREAWEAIDTLALKSIQLRKSIFLQKELASAIVYISGLGHYEFSFNGQKVGDSEFDPLWSDYDKTVYYAAYDVKNQLKQGENVLGVLLGNGFYNAVGNRYKKLWVSFGPPTLFFQLEMTYTDGTTETICSDKTWHYSLSPITYNDIYGGENYDANLEQPGWNKPGFTENTSWKSVVIQEAPLGQLRPQTATTVGIMKRYPVISVNRIAPGVVVLDMGQNLSGYPQLTVKGSKGSVIRLTVGELLAEDGRVSQRRSGGPHYYEYTLKGEGEETWSPRFSYYGFQYIQLDGADMYTADSGSVRPLVTDVQSLFVHNSAEETGSFTCSNELFNKIHVLIHNAVKSNFNGVFTDCPHREKLGWLEEDYLNGPGLFFNYNLSRFIPKLIQDMLDAQHSNGLVPSIVPEYVVFDGDFSDSPEWGVACIMVPWLYYEYYGDVSLIRQAYPMMKLYIAYLTSRSDNGIVSHGLGDWYDYGTHPAGYAKNSPIAISATSHYYMGITYLMRAAELLGFEEDKTIYGKLAATVKDAYNKTFFNPETNQYATGSQFSNAVSIYLNLVEPANKAAVLANLVADIRQHGNRLTTGDIGNRYLFQALAENGLNDLMFDLSNHYDAPGYGYQLKYGVSTLTEQWDPGRGNSWNHFMMGQIDEWFFKSLAGIQADLAQPGFRHFFVKPVLAGNLTSVEATHKCLYGTINVSWKKTDTSFELTVDVPVNTTATVVLPVEGRVVRLNGKISSNVVKTLTVHSGRTCIIADCI